MATVNTNIVSDINSFLCSYFDAFYEGDVQKLKNFFHTNAHVYFSDGEAVTDWPLSEYFDIINNRQSAASLQLDRHDAIKSIQLAGDHTAQVIIECAMPPKYFIDFLSLLYEKNGWKIISKTSHVVIHE